MKKLNLLIAAALLLMSAAVNAQTFKVENSTRSNLELSLTIDDFNLQYDRHGDVEGMTIEMNGIFLPNKAGMPNLPVVSRYVAIPRGATVNVNVTKQVTETLQDVVLMPAPELPLDDNNTPMRYVRDEKVYNTDAFFPSQPIVTSEPMKIRDVDVVILSVTPFQYNPVSKELVVTRQLNLEVNFEGGDGVFGGDPRYRSTAWEHIIRDMVINENALPPFDYQAFIKNAVENRDTGCEYLIITPDNPEFVQLADSIKKFRTEQGILTDVVTVTECGGNTDTAIRDYLLNAYNNWDIPVSAVLILGDHNTDGTNGIVSYTMDNHPGGDGYNPYISDNRYADMGNDHIPDIVIGRITGRNYEELYHMINKDLQYERHPYTDPDFYDHPITAMGFQHERWFQLCSEVVNGFFEYELGKHPVRINAIYEGIPGSSWSSADHTNSVVNYFGPNGLGYIPSTMSHLTDWNGNWHDVNNNINAGAFIIQHRDHGSEDLWGEPRYTTSNINHLANPELTFVMSNNCLTGRFNYGGVDGTCFAEAFHRHQYGALGLIAATQVSYSFLNDVYVWGVYDNMWPEFMPTYGTSHPVDFVLPAYGNVAGKYFLQQSNWITWQNSYLREITYYLFHHHGDVYMNLYTEVPQTLDVTMLPVITQGDTQYELTATEGATICITSNGVIAALTTATGQPQTIEIAPQIVGNEVLLTITKQNYFRYSRQINVIPNEGPYLILDSFTINDNNNNNQVDFNEEVTLNVAIHNVGFADISNVNTVLTSNSPYVTINSSSATYETIGMNQIVNKNNAFTITVSDDVPDQTNISFTLTMSDGTYSFTDAFYIVANAPLFKVANYLIKDANGNPTDRLYKGETSQITFTIDNKGHSNSNGIQHSYSTNAYFITYQDPTINTDGINVNESLDVTFTVSVLNNAPDGAILEQYYDLSSNGYSLDFMSDIALGNCIENFEDDELNPLFLWNNTGNYRWIRDDNDPYEGNYCFTSTSIGASKVSRLYLGVETEIDDVFAFYYKGSVNEDDEFYFELDADRYRLTGDEWQYFEQPITAGQHVFHWRFTRKSNAETGSASIDLIKLPPMQAQYDDVDEVADADNIISIYPNPGRNELNIIRSDESATILQVFDFQGRLILEQYLGNGVTTINTEAWPTGLYLWKVGNETGKWIKYNH